MPLRLTICLLFLIFSVNAFAKNAVVFEIRRPISLDPKQSAPKDFYINAGNEIGLKKNMLVVVNRRTTLYDAYQNNSPGDLYVPVGQLRVIHVQKGLAVARLEQMVNRKNLPQLDYDAIMVGDSLDMETAKMATQKTAATQPEILQSGPADSADFSSLAPTSQTPVTMPLHTL